MSYHAFVRSGLLRRYCRRTPRASAARGARRLQAPERVSIHLHISGDVSAKCFEVTLIAVVNGALALPIRSQDYTRLTERGLQ